MKPLEPPLDPPLHTIIQLKERSKCSVGIITFSMAPRLILHRTLPCIIFGSQPFVLYCISCATL